MAQDEALHNDFFGFAVNPDNFQDELFAIASITAGVFVLYAALAIVVPEISGQTEAEAKKYNRLDTMLLILWLPVTPLIVYWGNVESFTNIFSSTMEQRLFGLTSEGASFMRLYIALQVLGTVVECVHGAKKVATLAHHVSSVAAYVNILYCRRSFAYSTVLGLSETTTVFLNFLMFSKHPRYKDWCDKYVPWLKPVSGVLLWLTWIPYRLVLFLFVMWWWAADMMSGEPIAQSFSTFEALFYPGVTLLLWVLSVMWFARIHRGMVKTVFGADGAGSGGEKNDDSSEKKDSGNKEDSGNKKDPIKKKE